MIPKSSNIRETSAMQQNNFSISSIIQECLIRTEALTAGNILARLF